MVNVINESGLTVGMPCTFGCWTDLLPGVITRVMKKKVVVREIAISWPPRDTQGRDPQGQTWPDQEPIYHLDKPRGEEWVVHLAKDGRWRSGNYIFKFGKARYYRDPSF